MSLDDARENNPRTEKPKEARLHRPGDQVIEDVGSLGNAYLAIMMNGFNGRVEKVLQLLVEEARVVRFDQVEGRKINELLEPLGASNEEAIEFSKALKELDVRLRPA